jgi:uncharacterized protein (DUF1015 family)
VNTTFAPFPALRYAAAAVGDLGSVWAPPYDVITAGSAAELRSRNPYNIVRITNPEGSGDERYRVAASTLDAWVADGKLARDAHAGFYVHRHGFSLGEDPLEQIGGERYERTGVWGLLKLEPFGGGIVLPHERTMSGPKADRLALMDACGVQLSPIFFICSDSDGRISGLLADVASRRPGERVEFPSNQSQEVWRVDRREWVDELASLMGEQIYLIADGHHRYETALAHRDLLDERGAVPTGRQANEFLMAYVVPESDPGLQLLPTHRVVSGDEVNWVGAALQASGRFDVKRLSEAELASVERILNDDVGRPTFVLVARGQEGGWLMSLRDADATSSVPSVAFHDVFMSDAVGMGREEQIERMSFVKDVGSAVESVRSGPAQAAALLAAPRVAQVREAAAAGERLPPKTTYFWPKVPTGVALHVIDPSESVI